MPESVYSDTLRTAEVGRGRGGRGQRAGAVLQAEDVLVERRLGAAAHGALQQLHTPHVSSLHRQHTASAKTYIWDMLLECSRMECREFLNSVEL